MGNIFPISRPTRRPLERELLLSMQQRQELNEARRKLLRLERNWLREHEKILARYLDEAEEREG